MYMYSHVDIPCLNYHSTLCTSFFPEGKVVEGSLNMILPSPPHTLVLNFLLFAYFLLFHCTKYRYICKQFIAKQAQLLNFTSFGDYKKLCCILFTTSNKTSIHCTAKYISNCLLLRCINDITNFYALLRFNVNVIFSYCLKDIYNF